MELAIRSLVEETAAGAEHVAEPIFTLPEVHFYAVVDFKKLFRPNL